MIKTNSIPSILWSAFISGDEIESPKSPEIPTGYEEASEGPVFCGQLSSSEIEVAHLA